MKLTDALFVGFQKILPRRALSNVVWHLARIETPWVKNFLIRQFMAYFKISLAEYQIQSIDDFASFNAFFTRSLKPDARHINSESRVIISPVDGRVSAQGKLSPDALWQTEIAAKRHFYSLTDLLGSAERAKLYTNGHFTTIYLAPFNYHKIHVPYDGVITRVHYCQGTLYSVNSTTARYVSQLFVRNERVVVEFSTAVGLMALVLVGALNVGCMSLAGLGEIRLKDSADLAINPRPVRRGDELGAFNMGSTVILITAPDVVGQAEYAVEAPVRLGDALLTLKQA